MGDGTHAWLLPLALGQVVRLQQPSVYPGALPMVAPPAHGAPNYENQFVVKFAQGHSRKLIDHDFVRTRPEAIAKTHDRSRRLVVGPRWNAAKMRSQIPPAKPTPTDSALAGGVSAHFLPVEYPPPGEPTSGLKSRKATAAPLSSGTFLPALEKPVCLSGNKSKNLPGGLPRKQFALFFFFFFPLETVAR